MALPQDPLLRSTTYRVVQEALTNAARHAPGSAVIVTVQPDHEWLHVEVGNDGVAAADGGPGARGRTSRAS
jgi:signal transduction histidine kinase